MTRIILLILLLTLSCDEPAIKGCTSPSACNFDPDATKSDGTCIQPEGCNNWCPGDDSDIGELDCAGICQGDSFIDDCGICDGDNSTCIDCEGNPNGTLIIDCDGVCGGTAQYDDCQQCTGGNTGLDPNYVKDCNGDCFGDAFIDDCGVCTEGNTPYTANFLKDECGICNGNSYRSTCLENDNCDNMDCEGVCDPNAGGYSTLNECANQCNDTVGCGWKPDENCSDCANFGSCALYGAELDTCGECSGGISGHIADSDKDCNGICFGNSSEDCFGICGGNAQLDECGVCDGLGSIYQCGCSNIAEGKCDCDGNTEDECGICGGSGPAEGEDCDGICVAEGDNLDENGYDCANQCGGNAQLDDCGVCNGDGYTDICIGTENCNNMDCAGNCIGDSNFGAALDCAGACLGSALFGCDGECCGGTTGEVCATADNCGTCDNDSSNDCTQDCNDVYGGTAIIDNCGTCAGGNTGIDPNQGTTPDGLYSCSDITLLVDAGICTDSDDCATQTCPTLLWDGINLNGFDFSACGINSVPDYVTTFNISTLNLNDNTFNNFPGNIINMTSLTNVNLQFNLIGNISSTVCTLTSNPCTVDVRNNLIFDCTQIPDCQNAGSIICE